MIFAFTGIGITILSTVEMEEPFTEFPFSTYSISFLTDDIIRLRYAEIRGQVSKIMMVINMRGGAHSKDIRDYEITVQAAARKNDSRHRHWPRYLPTGGRALRRPDLG